MEPVRRLVAERSC